MKSVLIAGIGNIFLGDDGFGCEVLRRLLSETLPAHVIARDFGIRSYDLAYALAEKFDTVILVDAAPRGEAPGTTYLCELDPNEAGELSEVTVDAHRMTPVAALQMARAVGPVTARLYLVGCEPEKLEPEEGRLGLSEPVQVAVAPALELIRELVRNQLAPKSSGKKSEVLA